MRILKVFFLFVCFSLSFSNCDQKGKNNLNNNEIVAEKIESISLHVSGMTCEIGCAKTIQSKLSKKDGITKASVVFVDSIAKVEFNSNKVSKEEIISFIDGIAGGDMYKASEITIKK